MSDVLGTIAQGVNPLTTMGQVVNVMRGAQDFKAQQFNLQQARLQPAYAGLMALRLKGDAVTNDDVMASLADSARLGGDVSGLTDNWNAALARGGPNPAADFVRSESIRGMPSFEQFGAVSPEPTSMNVGGQQIFGTISPRGGAAPGQFQQVGAGVGLGVGPEFANQTGQWQMPDGSMFAGTRGQYLQKLGADPNVLMGGGAVGASSGAPVATPPSESKQAFIQSFTPTAQRIAKATGLPVNYVIAQAGLETGWGTSSAYQRNNFFGISAPGQPGTPASYANPDEGANAYVNLVNSRYANVPRTGSLQDIGDNMARAGYNPALPGAQGGSYGQRIASFGAGLPYQVAGTAPVAGEGGGAAPAPARGGLTLPGPYLAPQFEYGAKNYAAAQQANAELPARISPLLNSLSIIHANPTLTTGPGEQNIQQWAQWFRDRGINADSLLGIKDPNNVTAWQELSKFLKQYDQGIPGSQSSDLARLQTEASQPNTEQGRNAIAILAGKAIGNEMMNVARYRYFQANNQGVDPSTGYQRAATRAQYFNLETADWAGRQDPMAYAAAAGTVPPEAMGQYMRGLSPAMQKNFVLSLRDAQRLFPEMAAPAPAAGGG